MAHRLAGRGRGLARGPRPIRPDRSAHRRPAARVPRHSGRAGSDDAVRMLLLIGVLAASASAALAQESSLDRAELDAAAGRALFQATPLSRSIGPAEAPPAAAPLVATPPTGAPEPAGAPARRPVRVVYPGPYGR